MPDTPNENHLPNGKYNVTRAHNCMSKDGSFPYSSQGRNGTAITAAVDLSYWDGTNWDGSPDFSPTVTLTPVTRNHGQQNAWIEMSPKAFTNLATSWLTACGYTVTEPPLKEQEDTRTP